MDSPVQVQAELVKTEAITNTIFRQTYNAPAIASSALPGQFIMVQVEPGYDPLLRRPFSIHQVHQNHIQILFKVVGKGTRILSEKRIGALVDLVGPLGNHFQWGTGLKLLIGGGMGIAPLLFLASAMQHNEKKEDVRVLLGACDRVEIEPFCQEFESSGAEVFIATDNGSLGHCGFVTDLFLQSIENVHPKEATIFSCGPHPMMAKVAAIAMEANLSCQVSLETTMACGVAACLGCAVKAAGTDKKYLHVCKDGPVFDAASVVWSQS